MPATVAELDIPQRRGGPRRGGRVIGYGRGHQAYASGESSTDALLAVHRRHRPCLSGGTVLRDDPGGWPPLGRSRRAEYTTSSGPGQTSAQPTSSPSRRRESGTYTMALNLRAPGGMPRLLARTRLDDRRREHVRAALRRAGHRTAAVTAGEAIVCWATTWPRNGAPGVTVR